MCGISGIAALSARTQISEPDVRRMLPALRHRGPDGSGVYLDPNGRIGLGHTRLSIIDLASGAQPMTNEDRTVWVSFNGEIFNYIELREILLKAGHRFSTHSDTEVIVHAYEQYGDDFVQYLNGQFAIALWDTHRQRLLLIRDRVGILPLFYTRQGERLLFASEIKALLPLLAKAPQISPAALDQIFTFWSPSSPNTLFEDIFEVPPGYLLVLENGQVRESAYWDWRFPEQDDYLTGSTAELAEELYELLADATRIRLRADVPVGAYLSGGLDSSALVALIRRHSDAPLKTFSIGFEDKALDESVFQQQLVEHLGVEHHRVFCHNRDIAEDFPATVFHAETAILRTAPTPMRRLSGLVRASGYKVVLTGEGADEALGGYDLFKETKIRQFWARNPRSKWRPLLLKALYPYLETAGAQAKPYLRNFYGIGLEDPQQPGFSHLTRWFTTAQCKVFFSP
ncbi:MAG: asparagine synthase (glutamine-hydrolyzing), partial [Candidatus Competibacteraceae bacterium]|nr:asparagine synthase (glutamine-hydrolyzing) [Candidatus Competibacteraceae bacterium]